MIYRMKSEIKIIGANLYIISTALVVFLVFLALLAGNLLDVGSMGFEVIFPFYTAIAVGEWGKTRADDNYDVIAAQGRSVFRWGLIRYITVVSVVSLFAVAGMIIVSMIRGEMTFMEMLLTYFPTAFLLSSLGMASGSCSGKEHVAAMVCGIVWLAALMAQGLLRIPFIQYVYPFIRFGGIRGHIWIINKGILCLIGAAIWCGTYLILKGGRR